MFLSLVTLVLNILVCAVRVSLKLSYVGIELSRKISEKALAINGEATEERKLVKPISFILRVLIRSCDIMILLLSLVQVVVFLLGVLVVIFIVAVLYSVIGGA